jgi:hypothetical protein
MTFGSNEPRGNICILRHGMERCLSRELISKFVSYIGGLHYVFVFHVMLLKTLVSVIYSGIERGLWCRL